MTKENGCPICEALGLPPPCQGHGNKNNDDEEKDKEDRQDEAVQVDSSSTILLSLVLCGPAPKHNDENELEQRASLTHAPSQLGIDFDRHKHTLTFSKKALSPSAFRALKTHLEYSLEAFKEAHKNADNEVSNIHIMIDNEKIIIKMPSQKLLNAFVKHLMQDNLFPNIFVPKDNAPTEQVLSKTVVSEEPAVKEERHTEQDESSTPPTSFSMQPTPQSYSGE